MKGQTHGGKGSTPRPTNKRRFDENFEKIFAKKTTENKVELDEGVHTSEGDGRGTEGKLREVLEGAGLPQQADEEQAMSAKCKAFSESKLGLEPVDNRQAFYAGWDAAIANIEFNFCPRCGKRTYRKDWVHTCTPPLQEK